MRSGSLSQGPNTNEKMRGMKEPALLAIHNKRIFEDSIIDKIAKLVEINMKNHCYANAIFYADKVLHLCSATNRPEKYVQALYDLGTQAISYLFSLRTMLLLE
jgi:hypothetical protein